MKMKAIPFLMVLLAGSLLFGSAAFAGNASPPARAIDPIVSTEWLQANSGLKNLVILDIRSAADYEAGHIPNAVNVPFVVPESAWITVRDGLLLELPDEAALFETIGSCGITADSLVVIVTTKATPPNPPYPLANATRVADTLIYAGVKNVAILDGGYPKWAAEGRPVTKEVPKVKKVKYTGKVNPEMFVSAEYVLKHIGRSVIIDARDADVYFGVKIEPFANQPGHIPTARCLPTPWMWNEDGTYKQKEVLAEMASSLIGDNKSKEVIVYCGVGGYASSWWYVLTQVLGYENVKIYDGAAQDWVRNNYMVKYQWTV
jgi:thiosulfate/3-mercaptopyruvate sulfurtransferase